MKLRPIAVDMQYAYAERREVSTVEHTAAMTRATQAELLITEMLSMIEPGPLRPGIQDTPRRVAKSWGEIYSGYAMDPKAILKTQFVQEGYKVDSLILCKNIELYSMCEHHVLPFTGLAHVAYIPKKKVVGLSKLARLVDCFSRRLQIQEKLTNQIADALMEYVDPLGAAVLIDAKHHCMASRGAMKQHSSMITSALRGVFLTKLEARTEFLDLVKS